MRRGFLARHKPLRRFAAEKWQGEEAAKWKNDPFNFAGML
jgi:hypothetical protein